MSVPKLEETNIQSKVKRLAFSWRRLNFERPSPEYVLQQVRILGWFWKWHVSALLWHLSAIS